MSGGLGISRTYYSNSNPIWQGTNNDIQLLQGGCTLVVTGLTVGSVVSAGSLLVYNEATRLATVLHSGKAYALAGASAVAYQVEKGHSFVVGDNFASGAIGGKAFPITIIDTSNVDYDTITVGTTIGAVAAGDTFYASTATGATASALPAINARLYDDVQVATGKTVSPVIRGTVYARRVPNNASIEAALKTNGAYIIHSQSL
jgi:hypothetical protein